MKLTLAYYGDPVLRKKCRPIETIDDDIKQLVQDMVDTMREHRGIGLAAPQVHRSLNLFIIDVPTEGPDDTWTPGKLHVFINPKIVSYSEDNWTSSEGCLSIPKVYGHVKRPVKIKVRAINLEGQEFEKEFEGMEARAIMHENDHINGVLFIDRVFGKERKQLDPLLKEIKKKYPCPVKSKKR